MTRNRLIDPATTPKAIEDCHGLLAWMLPQLDKFLRSRRFTLGVRIEDGLLFVGREALWLGSI